jgi:hypothetical protein
MISVNLVISPQYLDDLRIEIGVTRDVLAMFGNFRKYKPARAMLGNFRKDKPARKVRPVWAQARGSAKFRRWRNGSA